MKAVARGVGEGPARVPQRVIDAYASRHRELLGEAIDLWPLLVQTPGSFVDRDCAWRARGGPRAWSGA